MAKDNKIHMPGSFGGLMRYDEEYESRFMLSPWAVIAIIAVIVLGVIFLKVFWPIAPELVQSGSVPLPAGFILGLD